MLLSNSRIEKNIGIKYYEKDILIDDHIYTGDIQVNLNVDYINSGIGIALISNEGVSAFNLNSAYLVRLGNLECSLIKKNGANIQVLQSTPLTNVKPYYKNLKIELRMNINKLSFYVNNELIFRYYLMEELGNYNVGYYSNAENTINSITIASQTPTGWIVNLNNTNGGYIDFAENQFTLSNCSSEAEIEQIKIPLKCDIGEEKTFFVGYERDGENNDIKAYVFYSNDDRIISNEEKNIMNNRRFTIKKDCEVSLKFIGTKGTIKNISISENNNDFFVGTSFTSEEMNGSYIIIKTSNDTIEKIELSGIVYGIPDEDGRRHILYKDYVNTYGISDLGVLLDKRYNYLINPNTDILSINGIEYEVFIMDSITMFDNMDAIIDKFLIYKKDGTIIDVLLQDTDKIYVPSDIDSPIIITGEDGVPLDISSSYRVFKESNGINKYIFTNIEREVFEPKNIITLKSKASKKLDILTIYGILKEANINKDNLLEFDGTEHNINSYCDMYDTIRETQLYKVDKNANTIMISDYGDAYIQNKYKEIIVDYLKEDSYAINYKHELGSYEVDISTDKNIKIYYDGIIRDGNEIINSNSYKLINVDMLSNSYIVLKMR